MPGSKVCSKPFKLILSEINYRTTRATYKWYILPKLCSIKLLQKPISLCCRNLITPVYAGMTSWSWLMQTIIQSNKSSQCLCATSQNSSPWGCGSKIEHLSILIFKNEMTWSKSVLVRNNYEKVWAYKKLSGHVTGNPQEWNHSLKYKILCFI